MEFDIRNYKTDETTAMGTYIAYLSVKTASIMNPHSKLFLFMLLGTLPVTILMGIITSTLVYVS